MSQLLPLLCLATLATPAPPPPAAADLSAAHRVVSLVGYIASDYPAAIAGGKVINAAEHAEHLSLAGEALRATAALDTPGTTGPSLLPLAQAFERRIVGREDARAVEEASRRLRDALVERFRLPTFPREAPDLVRGRALYVKGCAACHGLDGRPDDAIANRLDPRPTVFADALAVRPLSPYRAFNTTSFGIPGTAMPSYGESLPEKDRWDLAFYVLALRHAGPLGEPDAAAYERAAMGSTLPDLAVASDEELLAAARRSGLDEGSAEAALAFARRVAPGRPQGSSLDLARRLLGDAARSAAAGRPEEASRHALDAYLLGVEPSEGLLRGMDAGLTRDIESGFLELREAIRRGEPKEPIASRVKRLDGFLADAQGVLGQSGRSPWYAFLAALAIVVREGVEAALVVGALLAVLRRAAPGSPALTRRVHAAWVSALGLGVLTWVLAQSLLRISPGAREAAEGIISLVASALLFSASYWLLSNADVKHWVGFLRRKTEGGAGRGRGASIFAVSFLAVYREVFETVLFFQALLLGAPAARLHVAGGAVAGAFGLGAVLFVLFHIGSRLPLKPFFAASSLLLGALSFVLAGEGVHALQQAGLLGAPAVPFPAFPTLGIHPTVPGLAAQGLILALFVIAAVVTAMHRHHDAGGKGA